MLRVPLSRITPSAEYKILRNVLSRHFAPKPKQSKQYLEMEAANKTPVDCRGQDARVEGQTNTVEKQLGGIVTKQDSKQARQKSIGDFFVWLLY